MRITLEGPLLQQAANCEPILRNLPEWFGIEEANLQYLQDIEELPTFLAWADGRVVGFLTVKTHFPQAAELYVVGVLPTMHHQGVGRALLLAAEGHLRQQGVRYLQVKTLGYSHTDENYAKTRAFYEAMDFQPLEEIPQIWGAENSCLLLVKSL